VGVPSIFESGEITMKRLAIASLVLPMVLVSHAQRVSAHCEVPCGIYADQLRFEQMLEDQTTIAKAIKSMNELIAGLDDGANPLSINQLVRWVTTKESHATNTQHIIAQYFMTQRIKPGADEAAQKNYIKKLTAAHAVMQAAMKCKQNPDPALAETLRKTILDFYRAYEGKEPDFHKH
jgi:nickel superoxide dismutase